MATEDQTPQLTPQYLFVEELLTNGKKKILEYYGKDFSSEILVGESIPTRRFMVQVNKDVYVAYDEKTEAKHAFLVKKGQWICFTDSEAWPVPDHEVQGEGEDLSDTHKVRLIGPAEKNLLSGKLKL